jgi:hypothetical protein
METTKEAFCPLLGSGIPKLKYPGNPPKTEPHEGIARAGEPTPPANEFSIPRHFFIRRSANRQFLPAS